MIEGDDQESISISDREELMLHASLSCESKHFHDSKRYFFRALGGSQPVAISAKQQKFLSLTLSGLLEPLRSRWSKLLKSLRVPNVSETILNHENGPESDSRLQVNGMLKANSIGIGENILSKDMSSAGFNSHNFLRRSSSARCCGKRLPELAGNHHDAGDEFIAASGSSSEQTKNRENELEDGSKMSSGSFHDTGSDSKAMFEMRLEVLAKTQKRIFTLCHEVVHIMLVQLNLDLRQQPQDLADRHVIFCGKVLGDMYRYLAMLYLDNPMLQSIAQNPNWTVENVPFERKAIHQISTLVDRDRWIQYVDESEKYYVAAWSLAQKSMSRHKSDPLYLTLALNYAFFLFYCKRTLNQAVKLATSVHDEVIDLVDDLPKSEQNEVNGWLSRLRMAVKKWAKLMADE